MHNECQQPCIVKIIMIIISESWSESNTAPHSWWSKTIMIMIIIIINILNKMIILIIMMITTIMIKLLPREASSAPVLFFARACNYCCLMYLGGKWQLWINILSKDSSARLGFEPSTFWLRVNYYTMQTPPVIIYHIHRLSTSNSLYIVVLKFVVWK